MKTSNKKCGLVKELSSAYFKAVQTSQVDKVKDVVAELRTLEVFTEPNTNNVVNALAFEKSGDSALHICAKNGHLEMLRYLVEEENANLELINFDGKTALHDAAQFSQIDIVEYLLSKGANVNVVKKADWTPLMLSCTKPNNLPVVQTLVNAGADLNFVNKDGWNCLHIAAREGNVQVLEYLLDSCDFARKKKLIGTKSRNGRKPIHTAVMHGRLEALKLLTLNCSPEELIEEDNCGSSPVMDACRGGFVDIVEFLVDEKHIDPAILNRNGVGLLHVSAEANQRNMIEVLVQKYKLNLNQPSTLLSFTPLHWATREGNIPAATQLLKLGADPHVKDDKGRTAMNLAQECQKKEICDLLSTFGI